LLPLASVDAGGDGPKKLLLEEMREKYQLHDRIEMLGAVQHADVRNVRCHWRVLCEHSLHFVFCFMYILPRMAMSE
jgi:phosphatidylinositol glycan class A protein